MILPLLALAQVVPAPPPVHPSPENEVVVIARKLRGWAGVIRTSRFGTTRCKTTRSTGDAEIDRIGCTSMAYCWPDTFTRLRAAHRRGLPKADAQRLEAEARADFRACDDPQRTMLIEALLSRRGARAGGDA